MLGPTSKRLLAVVLVGGLVAASASVAVAEIGVDITTEYSGAEGDTQAVTTTVKISPSNSKITDVVINVDETDSGFVDFNSFERSITPGDAEVNITYQGNGRFVVGELEPGESVTITFEAYPRTIKQESVDVATVQVEYVQQGQSLDRQETVTADTSSSSWFELQQAERRIQEMQWMFYAGIAAVVLLIAVAAALGWQKFGDGEDEDEDDPFS